MLELILKGTINLYLGYLNSESTGSFTITPGIYDTTVN